MTSTSTAQPRARPGRRGPRTAAGKARAAQNALKHGLRAQKYVVLPEEDAAAFAVLEAAMIAELAPEGVLQTVLARRVAVAAWRLARADRLEAEVFAERTYGPGANPGLALIRDGNGTRSFETLLRYRGAAMAEFWRAMRTLKALQAEPAATPMDGVALRREVAPPPKPNEPERRARPRLDALSSERPEPGSGLHESRRPWQSNQPGPIPANQPARLPRGPAHGPSNEPSPAELWHQVSAAGPGAQQATPGAITPPRARRNPAAALAQPARSTP